MTQWRKLLAREGVDLTTISGIDVVFFRHVRRFVHSKRELFFTYFKQKSFAHYIAVDPQELGRQLYRKYFGTPAAVKKYYREGTLLLASVLRTTRHWERQLQASPSLPTLREAYREFRQQFSAINHIYSITSWLAIEAWQKDFERVVADLVQRRHLEAQANDIMSSLSRPWRRTALKDLPAALRRGIRPSDLAAQYQFLRSWAVVWYHPIDGAWIRSMRTQATPAASRLLNPAAAMRMLRPSVAQRKLLALAPYLTFFKDWRDDVRRQHAYRWSFFFAAIARQFDVNVFDLGYLTLDEIGDTLRRGEFPLATIKRRKENPSVVTSAVSPREVRVYEGSVPKKYDRIRRAVEAQSKQAVVKGLVAQSGLAVGRAVVVRTWHDTRRVNRGDILIANTTHPNYLSAMKRAAAFVTNEGGIISHAAIVARELGKPCIVGTRIATKVFKDGDRVAVDADRGVVQLARIERKRKTSR